MLLKALNKRYNMHSLRGVVEGCQLAAVWTDCEEFQKPPVFAGDETLVYDVLLDRNGSGTWVHESQAGVPLCTASQEIWWSRIS